MQGEKQMFQKNKQNPFFPITSMIFGAFEAKSGLAAPDYKRSVTDHFNGKKFYNRIDSDMGFLDFLKFSLPFAFVKDKWPEWIDAAPKKIPRQRQTGDEISVTYINHATVLIQVDGINIITDPIFSRRTSSLSWIGPKRVRNPGVNFADLPDIDVILISHNHYDHLDIESLKLLHAKNPENQPPLILSGLGNGLLFDDTGFSNFKDLDWDDSVHFRDIEFIFTETRHRSGRGILDQNGTLWGGFVIKSRRGNIYFAGDSGYGPHFKKTYNTHGDFILALLPIGAYEPRWFMKIAHLNPQDAVTAHMDLNTPKSMGLHFGTFQLTYESINQPVIDLKRALKDKQVPESDFIVPEFGETFFFKP